MMAMSKSNEATHAAIRHNRPERGLSSIKASKNRILIRIFSGGHYIAAAQFQQKGFPYVDAVAAYAILAKVELKKQVQRIE